MGMWLKGIWEIIQIGLLNDNGDIGEDNPKQKYKGNEG